MNDFNDDFDMALQLRKSIVDAEANGMTELADRLRSTLEELMQRLTEPYSNGNVK